jgi:hypothetical protein
MRYEATIVIAFDDQNDDRALELHVLWFGEGTLTCGCDH